MNVIISHRGTDYRMSVVYSRNRSQYLLQFTSLKGNKGSECSCTSYMDAVRRFIKNCRFYGAYIPYIPTEEEFLGLEPQTLIPKSLNKHESSLIHAEVTNA